MRIINVMLEKGYLCSREDSTLLHQYENNQYFDR